MAFCYKCGNQIDDGAVFCPKCGANQNENAAPAPAPAPSYGAPGYGAPAPGYGAPGYGAPAGYGYARPPKVKKPERPSKLCTLPSAKGLLANALMFVAFTLTLLVSWFAVGSNDYINFPIVSHSKFFDELLGPFVDGTGLFVIAKIFVIISVVVFAAYLFFSFFDAKKFGIKANLRMIFAIIYLALIFLALLFTFIFMVSNEFITVSVGYIFIWVVTAVAGVAELTGVTNSILK